MKRSYWEDILDFGCEECGEVHLLEPVYLHCASHGERPTATFIDRIEGTAIVRCSACDSLLVALVFTDGFDRAAGPDSIRMLCAAHPRAGTWTRVNAEDRSITVECGSCRVELGSARVSSRYEVLASE